VYRTGVLGFKTAISFQARNPNDPKEMPEQADSEVSRMRLLAYIIVAT